eukprot:90804-Chlamydomonas_euryale.AAC.2
MSLVLPNNRLALCPGCRGHACAHQLLSFGECGVLATAQAARPFRASDSASTTCLKQAEHRGGHPPPFPSCSFLCPAPIG